MFQTHPPAQPVLFTISPPGVHQIDQNFTKQKCRVNQNPIIFVGNSCHPWPCNLFLIFPVLPLAVVAAVVGVCVDAYAIYPWTTGIRTLISQVFSYKQILTTKNFSHEPTSF